MPSCLSPWGLRAALLAVLTVASVPRMAVIPGMTAFVDELTWLEHADRLRTILADGPAKPDAFGVVLRHPGTPVALAAAIGNLSRHEGEDTVQANQAVLVRGRYAIVWAGILACVLLAFLAARIYGPLTGGLAGLLLAVSPFHIATSGWIQCDAPLTLFSIVSVLAFSIYLREGNRRWLYISAASGGLAIASKLPAIALFAVVGLVFLAQWVSNLRTGSREHWSPPLNLLRWSLTAIAVLYLAWPRLWLDPSELVSIVRWAGELSASHANYFLGRTTLAPAWYYYLIVVPFSLSTVELLGLIAVSVWGAWCLQKGRRPRLETLILLLWGGVFLTFMSVSGKKLGARYVLPLWPIFALLIARFCVLVLWPRVADVWGRLRPRDRAVTASLAAVVYLALATASILPRAPDLFAHANPLLGGLRTLNEITMVSAVAEMRVAQYLDTLPTDSRVLVAGHVAAVQWHAMRAVEHHPCGRDRPVSPTAGAADFLVVFSYEEQRCPTGTTNANAALGTEVKSFAWDGAVLARVYQLPGPSVR